MMPAAEIEKFDSECRLELDQLRLRIIELWKAPRLDEKELSLVYARMLMILETAKEGPRTRKPSTLVRFVNRALSLKGSGASAPSRSRALFHQNAPARIARGRAPIRGSGAASPRPE